MSARGSPRQQLRLERRRLLFVLEYVPISRGEQGEATYGLRHGLPVLGDAGLDSGASLLGGELIRLVENLPMQLAHIGGARSEANGLFDQREGLLRLVGPVELFRGAKVAADVVGPTRSERG